jgi:NADP-dependent alcohol dehydrogenase
MIGHELTAFYGLAHAESLAVVLPARWKLALEEKREKLTQYARRVWGFQGTDEQAPRAAIAKTVEFFHKLGMPTTLEHYGIDAQEAARRVRERFEARGSRFGENGDVDGNAAAQILRQCNG